MQIKKLLLIIFIILSFNGCAGPQDGVLSSLLMGGVFLAIFIISIVVHYSIKAAKSIVGITPDVEKKNQNKLFKEARKKYLKEISDDRKFVKKNYQQYLKDYKRKYPNSRHYLSRSGWINEVAKVKQKIKSHELSKVYRKIQKLTDREFIKLTFEKSGYTDYQIWSDRWARAKGRVERKKYDNKVKLLKVSDY